MTVPNKILSKEIIFFIACVFIEPTLISISQNVSINNLYIKYIKYRIYLLYVHTHANNMNLYACTHAHYISKYIHPILPQKQYRK